GCSALLELGTRGSKSSFGLATPHHKRAVLFAMRQNPDLSDISPADAFRRVCNAFEVRGFDTAAIRQWCIPEHDGQMLVEATRVQRPKRILEVGTYVGVSTLLMALANATATIVTVDPNLALATEMGSMNSDLGGL